MNNAQITRQKSIDNLSKSIEFMIDAIKTTEKKLNTYREYGWTASTSKAYNDNMMLLAGLRKGLNDASDLLWELENK